MSTLGISNFLVGKHLATSLALLVFACAALGDDKPKAPAKAPATSAAAAKSDSSDGGKSKGSDPKAAAHGATTKSPGQTGITTNHPTTGNSGKTPTPDHHTKVTPAAKGRTNTPTENGSVTRRTDGKVADLHDTKRGMEVHHTLSGNRRVEVERPDHSRVVAERGGGYVQSKPYMYRGHEYARRSYYDHGRYYHAYYGRYYYHNVYLNPYYPTYYYGRAYYGWVSYPWAAPAPYAWGWNGNPWYGYYGAFFTPYAVYASPSLWLTDYIIANSLAAAYQAQAAALSNPAPLTPEVKQLIADEVRQQVALEYHESQSVGQNAEPDAAVSSIHQLLDDGQRHVFVAGQDLDVVDAGGTECALSEGDALQLSGQTAPDALAATLAVLASKGGKECAKGDTVSVALTDLQGMQNHMRETIDQGLQELQKKQGQGGLPVAPVAARTAPVENPMAAIAPPPPPESDVAAEINQQSQEADKAEKDMGAGIPSGPGPSAAAQAPNMVNGKVTDIE